jgi:enterochelin esterase-like enzyme
MARNMNYAVYQPRDRQPEQRLPLVIFLHGGGDDVDCLDASGFGFQLDEAIAEGRVPPVVIAVPQGDWGFWENWVDGSHMYRDWVLDEMLPQVQKRYSTQPCPEGCHIMGISMGGHGALRFVFKRPDLFSSVTALSAPIFGTDQMLNFRDNFWWGLIVPVGRIWGKGTDRSVAERDDLFLHWTKPSDLGGRHLRIAWARKDHKRVVATNEHFKAHLDEHKMPYSWEVFPGKHEWDAWLPALERSLAHQLRPRD